VKADVSDSYLEAVDRLQRIRYIVVIFCSLLSLLFLFYLIMLSTIVLYFRDVTKLVTIRIRRHVNFSL